MEIILSKERVDLQECDLLVTGFFCDERPLRGSSGWVDWRFNGRFSRFLIEKNLSGDWNETILIPSEGRVMSRMVLLLGLGHTSEYSHLRLSEIARRLLEIAKRLEAFDICLSLPYGGNTGVSCSKMAEVLVEGLASALSLSGDPLNSECIKKLKIYFAEGEEYLSEILSGVQSTKAVLKKKIQIRILPPS